MPVLTIYTNLKSTTIPETFVDEASEVFAKAIGKDKQVSSCSIFSVHICVIDYKSYL